MRVASLQTRYTQDLHDALSAPGGTNISLADSALFGRDVGKLLVRRMCQLGAACTLHGDLKPENVLLLLPEVAKPGGGSAISLGGLRIADFDPQFLFTGCDCIKVEGSSPQELQVALFAVLNILLLWTWFEVNLTTSTGRGAASGACHRVLTRALSESSLPLDQLAAKMPVQLRERLQTWTANYRDKPARKSAPIWTVAVERFPGLQGARYDWAAGPRVAGFRVLQTFGAGGVDIDGVRRRLKKIARLIGGMTC
jgi:hypothetical protein